MNLPNPLSDKIIIGVDFDSTINNMLEIWLFLLNSQYGRSVRLEDVKEWDMKKAYPELTRKQIYGVLSHPDFWKLVSFKKDAVEILTRWLYVDDYDVFIVTHSSWDIMPAKIKDCINKYILWPDGRIINTARKDLFRCDYLIDDYEENLKNSEAVKILFDMPYNKQASHSTFDFRVTDWKDLDKLITQLVATNVRRA